MALSTLSSALFNRAAIRSLARPGGARALSLRAAETAESVSAPSSSRVTSVTNNAIAVNAAQPVGNKVEISFTDGSKFQFHALWLRDACRDAGSVQVRSAPSPSDRERFYKPRPLLWVNSCETSLLIACPGLE